MAKKEIVELIDDLTGEPADQTVEFALDGVTYEVDLTDKNANELRDQLAVFVENARRIGGRAKRGKAAKPNGGMRFDRATNERIRTWAREQGYTISARGRVPDKVVTAWEAEGRPEPGGNPDDGHQAEPEQQWEQHDQGQQEYAYA